MAVTPDDLKSPTGRIDPAVFFPGEQTVDVDTRLQAYIDEGESEADDIASDVDAFDAAVILWAYYRAFDAVHMRLVALPSMTSINEEGSTQYLQSQMDTFAARAAEFLAAFRASVDVSGEIVQRIATGPVSNAFTW